MELKGWKICDWRRLPVSREAGTRAPTGFWYLVLAKRAPKMRVPFLRGVPPRPREEGFGIVCFSNASINWERSDWRNYRFNCGNK